MPSTLNCSGRRKQLTRNTAKPGRRCSSFCGHRKISSDSSQMRHRSRTGSRAGKRNTPKVDFASAFGVLFCLYGDGSVPKERAACIHGMQFGKGLGSSQQAFLHRAGRTRSKKRDLVPGRTACALRVAEKSSKFTMLMLESPAAGAAQFGSNSPAVPAVPGCSDAVQSRNFANSLNRCGWHPSSSLWPWR